MTTPVGLVYRAAEGSTPGEFAERAERLGYESVWTSEAWGDNAVTVLTEMALATESVGLGTAILNVYSRTPALLAMSAVSLDRVSEGRIRLGLGTSHPNTIENLHGMAFEQPIERIAETVELLALFTGEETVEYDGELFEVGGFPPLSADVPVYNAALGPRNREVTGRLCDGWIPNQIPIAALETHFEAVAEGARAAGRDPDNIEVFPWVPAAVSDDDAAARDAIRECVAFYVGSFPIYRNAVAELYPEAADLVATEWETNGREAAAEAVDDDLVDAMGIAGSPERARRRLRELIDNPLIDVPIVSFSPFADDALISTTIEELAPSAL